MTASMCLTRAAKVALVLSLTTSCGRSDFPTSLEDGALATPSIYGTDAQTANLLTTATFMSPSDFQNAIAGLGTPTSVGFEDIDASPVNNTYLGRDPFKGNTYAASGITFSNPNGYPLYIAPGGLFWNASNSLSVAQFPFDDNAADATDDDLLVRLGPPAIAVGFVFVDNATAFADEFVQFIDADGAVVEQASFPADFTPFRAFLGIVSVTRPIAGINIVEAPNDGDDVNYDDFTFVSAGRVTVCHRPGMRGQKTMELKPQAVGDHLAHGDVLGACI